MLSVADYRMGLLASSLRAPGFSTFLSNLLRTDGPPPEDQPPSWHSKYLYGAGFEIWGTRLRCEASWNRAVVVSLVTNSPAFEGMAFIDVVATLYNSFGVVVIALRKGEGSAANIRLNPVPDTVVHGGDYIYMLAEDNVPGSAISHLSKLPGPGISGSAEGEWRSSGEDGGAHHRRQSVCGCWLRRAAWRRG